MVPSISKSSLSLSLRFISNIEPKSSFVFCSTSFYTAYKSSGLDFTSFFDHYQPHFEPRENCIGLALEVLNRANLYLSKQWPNLGSHLYLAACHINISTTWEAGMEKLWDDRASLDHRDSEHVLMDAGIKHTIGMRKIDQSK